MVHNTSIFQPPLAVPFPCPFTFMPKKILTKKEFILGFTKVRTHIKPIYQIKAQPFNQFMFCDD